MDTIRTGIAGITDVSFLGQFMPDNMKAAQMIELFRSVADHFGFGQFFEGMVQIATSFIKEQDFGPLNGIKETVVAAVDVETLRSGGELTQTQRTAALGSDSSSVDTQAGADIDFDGLDLNGGGTQDTVKPAGQ